MKKEYIGLELGCWGAYYTQNSRRKVPRTDYWGIGKNDKYSK